MELQAVTAWLDDRDVRIHVGDVLDVLPTLPDGSVDCVVTSPPYLGLRDYGHPAQIGLEPTIGEYVQTMVAVFAEVRRVMADHATLWLNLGDSYNAYNGGAGPSSALSQTQSAARPRLATGFGLQQKELKPKDLMGVPWRVAFALQADGWFLRSDIVWAKPNPMPESVTDRPTKAHEYVFLLSKRPRYYFDAEAVREPQKPTSGLRQAPSKHESNRNGNGYVQRDAGAFAEIKGANVRSVWSIATQPYAEAHFATYPEELVRRCLLAGCPVRVCRVCGRPSERLTDGASYYAERDTSKPLQKYAQVGMGHGGVGRGPKSNLGASIAQTVGWSDCGHNAWRPGLVLDPFAGSGTTLKVARDHARHAVGIELNEAYARLAADRLKQLSLLAEGAA